MTRPYLIVGVFPQHPGINLGGDRQPLYFAIQSGFQNFTRPGRWLRSQVLAFRCGDRSRESQKYQVGMVSLQPQKVETGSLEQARETCCIGGGELLLGDPASLSE